MDAQHNRRVASHARPAEDAMKFLLPLIPIPFGLIVAAIWFVPPDRLALALSMIIGLTAGVVTGLVADRIAARFDR